MQSLPAEPAQRSSACRAELIRFAEKAARVERVAEERMTEMRHMHPDLMRAAGLEIAAEKARDGAAGRSRESLDKLPMGDGFAAARRRHDRHLLPVRRVASERRLDLSGRPLGHPPDEGEIAPFEPHAAAVIGEEQAEAAMRGIRLRHDEKSRRILVEPMNDARPLHAADAG